MLKHFRPFRSFFSAARETAFAAVRGMTLLFAALLSTGALHAQESEALVNLFVRKGLVTDQEVEETRADLVREREARSGGVVLRGKSTQRISLGVLMMTQFSALKTSRDDVADPAGAGHFLLRRAVFGLRASLGEDWNAVFAYNFAGPNFAAAFLQWSAHPEFTVDVGLRKVTFGYEEYSSPQELRAIETAPATRYFTEANNGRRLGAASYRLGVFVSGRQGGFQYGGAITNPERIEDVETLATVGNATNNQPAFWGNVGFSGKLPDDGSYVVGAAAGFLPGQGGPGNTQRGQGHDLAVGQVFAGLEFKRLGLQAEYFRADDEAGGITGRDAAPWGYYIQPSFMFTKTLEGVVRYSFIDSDGRGIDLSDAVRSAPASGLMDSVREWYLGGNWYLKRNDLKLSLGFLYADGRQPGAATAETAVTYGVRSQMQVNF